jgi:predicted nucleic acid-binding protein
MHKYADQKLDLADATLMHLANRSGIDQVFTLDRRHFSIFRNRDGRALTIVP